MSVAITSDIPKSIAVGDATPKFVIDSVATVGAATTQGLSLVGAKSLEGTVDAKAAVVAPQGNIDVTVPIDMAKTPVPASGSFDVKATGTAPALTFGQPGSGKITVGDLTLHLAPKDAGGNLTGLGKFDSPCRLAAGQNNVLATFDITGTGTTTGSTTSGTSGTTGTTTSGTTGSTTSGTTGSTTSGTIGSTTSGTTGSTTAGTTGSTTAGTTGSTTSGTTTGTTGATTSGTTSGDTTSGTTAGTAGAATDGTTGSTGGTDAGGGTSGGSDTSGATGTSGGTGTTGGSDYGTSGQTIGTQVGDTTGGSLASTGSSDTGELLLLTVGTLVAGAAAFRFGTRLNQHRRPGRDD